DGFVGVGIWTRNALWISANSECFFALWILFGETIRQDVQRGLRLAERNAQTQARVKKKDSILPVGGGVRGVRAIDLLHPERQVTLRVGEKKESVKFFWRHADHGHGT